MSNLQPHHAERPVLPISSAPRRALLLLPPRVAQARGPPPPQHPPLRIHLAIRLRRTRPHPGPHARDREARHRPENQAPPPLRAPDPRSPQQRTADTGRRTPFQNEKDYNETFDPPNACPSLFKTRLANASGHQTGSFTKATLETCRGTRHRAFVPAAKNAVSPG